MRRWTFPSFVPLVLALAVPTTAVAQQRPYRGLFGGGYGATEQSLIFNSSLGTGYDTNVLRGVATPVDAELPPNPFAVEPRQSSTFSGAQMGLGYSLNRTTLSLSAAGGTSVSYYEALVRPRFNGHGGAFSINWRPNYRMTVSGNASVSYGPFSGTGTGSSIIDTGGPPPDALTSDFLIRDRFVSNLGASFAYNITRNIAASVGYAQQDDLWASGLRDLSSKQAYGGISYSRQIKKYFGVSVGYTYSLTEYTAPEIAPEWVGTHAGSFGVTFGRNGMLELTERTRLSFGVGLGSGRGLDPDDRLHYTVTGNVGLTRDIGRTFQAALLYNRGLGFDSFNREPTVTDSVTASYGGLLSRRLTFTSAVSASTSSVGFEREDNRRVDYTGSATLGYGLTRHLQANLAYFYTQFDVGSGIDLPLGFQHVGDRHTVRASISLRLPLFMRARRPNASR